MLKAFFSYKTSNPIVVIILFSLVAVILRFFSFFPSVIDHDESTYLEIARMILAGNTLYVDMIDIKPPGIFLILAGFQAVFGYSIFVLRLLVTLWIAVTAFMIYKTSGLLVKNERASLAAGIIYIFFISTWSFYGISITPEIFFNLFTISALYVLLKKQSLVNYMLAGLLAGMGFMVKYLVIFDFAAFMIFFIILNLRKKEKLNLTKMTFSIILAGIGYFIPFALMNLCYYLNGHFDALYNIVYLAPARYPSEFDPWRMLKFVLDFQIHFLPVFFFFYYVLINKKFTGPEISLTKKLCILWSFLALAAVLIAGKAFQHYTIQLMLPVSLMAGVFFHSERYLPAFLHQPFNRKTGRVILVVLILLITMMKLEYFLRKDIPREIATYLKPKLKAEDVIYTGNYHHILYYLLKKDSPTKYTHRSLLLRDNHIKALNINADEEFRHIMAHWPVYIILEKEYPAGIMKDFIKNNYSVEKDFSNGILLYRLNNF
ncbi:MAG: glycosyltransferase family 39 protein [Bacteroidales bacterium]|nr:glycosyltransferase family 39 protein [Bacteroidales bacterium]